MYRTGGSPQVEGLVGLRTGCLDDQSAIRNTPPMMEVYVEQRPIWRAKIEGAMQLNGKYEPVDGSVGVQ